MRWLLRLFAGLILLAVMFAALFVAGAIFDANKKIEENIETFFFQPDNNPERRPGVPASPEDIGDMGMLEKLIDRYITAYFYVTPDMTDTDRRIAGSNTALVYMSDTPVFDYWKKNIAPEIKQMSADKMLRLVRVTSIDKETVDGNYWRIGYETTTWTKPNDLSVVPQTYNGILYMNIIYEPGMRSKMVYGSSEESIGRYLEQHGDPAAVFKFGVTDVIMPKQ